MSESKDKKSLNQSNEGEAYAKQLDAMLSDIVSVPHFNDKDIELEKWAIHFFHKETKEQIEWTIILCLLIYITETRNKISHVIENKKLKEICFSKEQSLLGKNMLMVNNLNSLEGFRVKIAEEE